MTARNDERREQVRKMREAGMSYKAIGAALDPPVSKAAIHILAKRCGFAGRVKLSVDLRGRRRIKEAARR